MMRERYDLTTGEVIEPASNGAKPRRPKRTPEEQADAARAREERAELRRQELAAIRALDPACEVDSDPPIMWLVPVRLGGEPSGFLYDRPRASGRGKHGSRLVLAPRYYDGQGPNGGLAHHSVTAHVIFRDGAGYLRRSMGVAIHESELRDVGAALIAYADALEGEAGK